MGIPWYFYTIYTKYNTDNDLMIDENVIPDMHIDHLFLDYNSMIHPCAQRTLQSLETDSTDEVIESAIIKDCIAYTRYIVNVVKPKRLYVMIDGVAPRAKMNQQRERRYKSHFYKLHESEQTVNTDDTDDKLQKVTWNSNKITPGTGFMRALQDNLRAFKDSIEGNLVEEVYISDSDEPGEGEHKMMSYITNTLSSHEKICIYGLDADLIMLGLLNVHSDNIVLLRDNTFNNKLIESKRTYTYLHIGKLKGYICKELRVLVVNESIKTTTLLTDYIFLCFLLGNDFLEHIPSLLIRENATNILTKHYANILNTKEYTCLIDTYQDTKPQINLQMLCDIFNELSRSEDYFFQTVYSVYKNPNKVIYRDTVDLETVNKSETNLYFYTRDVIRYNEPGYKSRYYKFYGIDDVDDACKSYLTGLYWTLGYYRGHEHQNWSWYYRYHATPFVSDLHKYLIHNTPRFTKYISTTHHLQPSVNASTLEQLYMVLPKQSLLEILPSVDYDTYSKSVRVFHTQSTMLETYYPNKICLDMIHREYLWQAKIFLKTFDPDFIQIFM